MASAPPVPDNLPRERRGKTHSFRITNHGDGGGSFKGYLIVSELEDGRPVEVFFKFTREGSTLAGFGNWVAILLSQGLQSGVPLMELVKTPMGMAFPPYGSTDDPEIPMALSVPDYVSRRLALWYCTDAELTVLGLVEP